MKQRIISRSLAVAVIILFLGLAIQPSVAVQPETEIDIEPKDYLFQTIIDIANNPDVKELFEQYNPDLFKFDIDRSIHRKLFLRNPRLMFNTLFTKSSLSVEYLNKCYNNGIRITNILGEDKVLEIMENVEVTDTKLFDELNYIISKDEELSGRFETLKEMNKELKTVIPFIEYLIFCAYLILIMIPLLIVFVPSFLFAGILGKILYNFPEALDLFFNLSDKFPKLFSTFSVYLIIITVVFAVWYFSIIDCFFY
ncbi:MAG: hypothetical protein JSU91_06605 [Thermoplasmatales archaeon]|nr:MAG: hypothetical protein JSU91_06605 [Thermoplasmatales archaeon]